MTSGRGQVSPLSICQVFGWWLLILCHPSGRATFNDVITAVYHSGRVTVVQYCRELQHFVCYKKECREMTVPTVSAPYKAPCCFSENSCQSYQTGLMIIVI